MRTINPFIRNCVGTAVLALSLAVAPAHAVITIAASGTTAGSTYVVGGANYTQNFNGLVGGNATFPYNNGGSKAWTDDSTMAGWYTSSTAGSLNGTSMKLSNGTANPGSATGAVFSYGLNNDSDRALGVMSNSSTANGYAGLAFLNSSGMTLSSFTIGYTGEQWREATTARITSLSLEYKVGAAATDLNASTGWTAIPGSTFSSTLTTVVANSTLIASSVISPITVSATINNGQSIWFRWVDTVSASNTTLDEIGIDDVNVSFIPEPATFALWAGALGVGLVGLRRWKLKHNS